MSVSNPNDPHAKFKAAAKKVQKCLAENMLLESRISEVEYILEGVRGINYERIPGSHSSPGDDSRRMSLWETKETLEAKKKANSALIQWVFSVMEEVKRVSIEDYHLIFAAYICHKSITQIASSAGIVSKQICKHSRKTLSEVLTEEKLAELETIEVLRSMLGTSLHLRNSSTRISEADASRMLMEMLKSQTVRTTGTA